MRICANAGNQPLPTCIDRACHLYDDTLQKVDRCASMRAFGYLKRVIVTPAVYPRFSLYFVKLIPRRRIGLCRFSRILLPPRSLGAGHQAPAGGGRPAPAAGGRPTPSVFGLWRFSLTFTKLIARSWEQLIHCRRIGLFRFSRLLLHPRSLGVGHRAPAGGGRPSPAAGGRPTPSVVGLWRFSLTYTKLIPRSWSN